MLGLFLLTKIMVVWL